MLVLLILPRWTRSSHNVSKFLPDIRSIQAEYCNFIREYLADPKTNQMQFMLNDWLTMEAGMLAKRAYRCSPTHIFMPLNLIALVELVIVP